MLTGRHVRPKQALQMGLVDKLAPAAQLRDVARSMALSPPPVKAVEKSGAPVRLGSRNPVSVPVKVPNATGMSTALLSTWSPGVNSPLPGATTTS